MPGFRECALTEGRAWVPLRPEWKRVKAVQQEYNTVTPPRGYVPTPEVRLTLGYLRTALEQARPSAAIEHITTLERLFEIARPDISRDEVVATINGQLDVEARAIAHMVHHWDGVRSPETGDLVPFNEMMTLAEKVAAVERLPMEDHKTLIEATIRAWRIGQGLDVEDEEDPNDGAPPQATSDPAEPSPKKSRSLPVSSTP